MDRVMSSGILREAIHDLHCGLLTLILTFNILNIYIVTKPDCY